MIPERRLRILGRLVDSASGISSESLCQVCAETTACDGAGIMLFDRGVSRGSLCSTDDVSALIEELQFSLGEGPCIDACRARRPVLEPNLASPHETRWMAFAPPAVAAGAAAVFGFPIGVGTSLLGALNLYRTSVGPLSAEHYADALVLADIAVEMILFLQAGAPPGELAAELQRDASFHYLVHQAAGMVSAQLDVDVEHALIRLRAHSFRTGTPLVDVAKRVVDRSLRFPPHDQIGAAP